MNQSQSIDHGNESYIIRHFTKNDGLKFFTPKSKIKFFSKIHKTDKQKGSCQENKTIGLRPDNSSKSKSRTEIKPHKATISYYDSSQYGTDGVKAKSIHYEEINEMTFNPKKMIDLKASGKFKINQDLTSIKYQKMISKKNIQPKPPIPSSKIIKLNSAKKMCAASGIDRKDVFKTIDACSKGYNQNSEVEITKFSTLSPAKRDSSFACATDSNRKQTKYEKYKSTISPPKRKDKSPLKQSAISINKSQKYSVLNQPSSSMRSTNDHANTKISFKKSFEILKSGNKTNSAVKESSTEKVWSIKSSWNNSGQSKLNYLSNEVNSSARPRDNGNNFVENLCAFSNYQTADKSSGLGQYSKESIQIKEDVCCSVFDYNNPRTESQSKQHLYSDKKDICLTKRVNDLNCLKKFANLINKKHEKVNQNQMSNQKPAKRSMHLEFSRGIKGHQIETHSHDLILAACKVKLRADTVEQEAPSFEPANVKPKLATSSLELAPVPTENFKLNSVSKEYLFKKLNQLKESQK